MTDWKGRDPTRIPQILDKLKEEWQQRSDLRLGQILTRHTMLNPLHPDEDYASWLDSVEDDVLINRLLMFLRVIPTDAETRAAMIEAQRKKVCVDCGSEEIIMSNPPYPDHCAPCYHKAAEAEDDS